jgi:hypothetical protein
VKTQRDELSPDRLAAARFAVEHMPARSQKEQETLLAVLSITAGRLPACTREAAAALQDLSPLRKLAMQLAEEAEAHANHNRDLASAICGKHHRALTTALANLPAAQVVVDDAMQLIAAERRRQIAVEGWTPEHDDQHKSGALTKAACCYARGSTENWRDWPSEWAKSWWKPTPNDRIRELTKAGALIVAEIERLHRAAIAAAIEGK